VTMAVVTMGNDDHGYGGAIVMVMKDVVVVKEAVIRQLARFLRLAFD